MGKGGAKAVDTKTEPWAKAQPYILDFLKQSEAASDNPLEMFGGQMTAGQSNDTVMGQDMIRDFIGGEMNPVNSMNEFLGQVMGGEFMGGQGQNPLLDQQFGVMSKRIGEQFNQITMPGINSRMAGAGRSGSAAAGRARGRADETLVRELGDLGTQIYYGDYERRMGDRFTAAGMAPGGQAAALGGFGALQGSGLDQDQYSQKLLNESIERFNFSQTEPEERLDRYGNRVQGMTAGYNKSQQVVPTSNDTGAGISAILGLVTSVIGAV